MSSPATPRPPVTADLVYRFGLFELCAKSGELRRKGHIQRLPEQPLQILLTLLESPGEVVSREALRARLWPVNTFVDFEIGLNAAMKRLRRALSDDAVNPIFIETLPKRGYRLIAPVTCHGRAGGEISRETSRTETGSESSAGGRVRRQLVLGIALAVSLLILAITAMLALRARKVPVAPSGSNSTAGIVATQRNGQAYELYLRSLTYKLEPPDNSQAIELLERSTALDPGSARAWYELAHRYHFEYSVAARGQSFLQLALQANRHALELAPDFSQARLHQVTLATEGGRLGSAYDAALAMIRANPQDGNAHFALSYVLRYGGMWEEAAKECELALKFDSSNPTFRSCSFVFIELGRADRARAFADLDPLSSYTRFRRTDLAILANDKAAALQETRSIHLIQQGWRDYPEARMVEAFLSGTPQETVLNWSRESEALYDRINLSEGYFVTARYQSWVGQSEPALRLLRRAVANNYCFYPVIETDPFLANVRMRPEYAELKKAGVACHDEFRAHMEKAR